MSKNQSRRRLTKLIGRRIKFFRTEQKMGRRLLTAKSGVNKMQISAYEKGEKVIAADHLFAISKALNVDIISFFPSFVNSKDGGNSSVTYTGEEIKAIKKFMGNLD